MQEENKDDLFDPDSDEIEVIYDRSEEEDEYKDPDMEKAVKKESSETTSPDELAELNDKYLRLYSEFENYKKKMSRDKEELVKYANESLIYEFLPSIDNLETALKHVDDDTSKGLVEGVEMTLREMYRVLEKFGLQSIETEGKKFDPEFHHAMSQVERDDIDENTVVEELRKGFKYRDKILRASMVTVSMKPSGTQEQEENNNISELKEE
jgi:molecular chaperone GrpE